MRGTLLWGISIFLMPGPLSVPYSVRSLAPADTDSVTVAIVTGDSLAGMEINGEYIQYIVGRVQVVQDSTQLASHRAERNVTLRESIFIGSVSTVDRGDTLLADTLLYDEANKVGRASGNVQLTDGDVVAYATTGWYAVEEKRAEFPDGLRLVDSTAVVTGLVGEYWTQEKRAELAGDVHLGSEEWSLWADSLTHLRVSRVSVARSNVVLAQASDTDSIYIFGEWARRNEESGHSNVTGQPLLMQLSRDSVGTAAIQSPDTLLVRASELNLREDAGGRRHLTATRNVRVWRQQVAAVADSMVFIQREEELDVLWLFGMPVVWVEDTQVAGDTVKIVLDGGDVDSLLAFGNAFVAQMDSITGRINQARGRSLIGSYGADSISVFTLRPNAEVLYFYKDNDDAPDGALQASGDEVQVVFKENTLQTFRFGIDIQGTRYPETGLPNPLGLQGVRWIPDGRPKRAVLLADSVARQNMPNP